MKRYDVLALGELLIDFTPSGETEEKTMLFARNPGGAPANVVVMCAKLGGGTAFIGKVGADDFGRFLGQTLCDSGVDISGLVADRDTPTTLAFVQLSEHGARDFSFYRSPGADMMLRADEVRRDMIDACDIFHFGAVSLTDDPSRTATLDAAEYAGRGGALISFDPNYRPRLWRDEAQALEQIGRGIALADVIKVSEEEATLLTGEVDARSSSRGLLRCGPSLVLVTMGCSGTFYRNQVCCGHVPAYVVNAVDTTGAGDAFMGAMLDRIKGMTAAQLGKLPKTELEQAVRFANAAGGLATTKIGAIPSLPTRQEILSCME